MSFTSTDPQCHNSENTWFTPMDLILKLGEFDTDPCTVSYRPFDVGKSLNIEHDKGLNGLNLEWGQLGRMFINPPYGKEIMPFIDKFILEKPDGLMLIFARMGNVGIQKLLNSGAYFFFLRNRVRFVSKGLSIKSNAGTDSALVFWKGSEFEKIKVNGSLARGVYEL